MFFSATLPRASGPLGPVVLGILPTLMSPSSSGPSVLHQNSWMWAVVLKTGKAAWIGRSQKPWELLPVPPPLSLETPGKSFSFSEPLFSHLLNGDNKT